MDYRWNEAKNEWLKRHRGISFEEVVEVLEEGKMVANAKHPNQSTYPGQRIYVIETKDYIYYVPYVLEKTYYFLKTIIPSRKLKKKYTK